MRILISLFSSILLISSCTPGLNSSEEKSTISSRYPISRKSDHVDTYFDRQIPDPYRWLEDENAPETREWIDAQNKVTDAYFDSIPYRDEIRKRLTDLWNFEKFSAPFREGKHYFQYRNNGVQNQYVLFLMPHPDSLGSVLIDPNTFSSDGTTALADFSVNARGDLAVFGISEAGSDWKSFQVIELPSGKKRSDRIDWVKFSGIAWHGDGFFYSAFDRPDTSSALTASNLNSKVYYHKLGTPQSSDQIIYSDSENPHRNFYTMVTDDEKYLVISESETTSGNGLFLKDLTKKNSPVQRMADGFQFDYQVIDHVAGKLIILTNDEASRYRVMAADPANPARENWTELIAERDLVLQDIHLMDGKIVGEYLKDVTHRMLVFHTDGSLLMEMPMPGLGVIGSFNSKLTDDTAWFSYNTFTMPPVIYRYDLSSNKPEIIRSSPVNFDADQFETRQVFYQSKDGSKIPMFLIHRKGLQKDGRTPVLLYGYGGFNISITPGFRTDHTVFLENGGIYAVANIRGGGEYGKDWHMAGIQLKKQNVFDDFIAAAEYLIYEGYTNEDKIAITGRSNGGLLIGAAMTQRPELFEVAIPVVGVLDMLRYHEFTIGRAWSTDYGTSEDPIQLENLLSYSPLHNVKNKEYPATLIMTGDHDDRVVPAHSFKFAATLQEKSVGSEPILIRIDKNAGHGAGKPVSKLIDEATDFWSFVFHNLEMKYGTEVP